SVTDSTETSCVQLATSVQNRQAKSLLTGHSMECSNSRTIAGFLLLLLHDDPALHHPFDTLKFRDVFGWIAVDGDQVGVFARFNRAGAVFPPEQLRRVNGRGPNRLERRHAEFDVDGELAPVQPVRVDRRVGAEGDGHALRESARDVL